MILKVIEEAISAIRQGRYVTLRDIYYRDTELFGNQLAVTTVGEHDPRYIGAHRRRSWSMH